MYGGYPGGGYVQPGYGAPMGQPMMGGAPGSLWEFQLGARHLDNKDVLGKSDPYMRISCNGRYIHKTETISNNLNPVWAPFTLDLMSTCGGDMNNQLTFEVYDEDARRDELIGRCMASINQLQGRPQLRLDNPRRIGFSNRAGELYVIKCNPAGGMMGMGPGAAPMNYGQPMMQPGYGQPMMQPGYGAPMMGQPGMMPPGGGYGYPPAGGGYPPPGGY